MIQSTFVSHRHVQIPKKLACQPVGILPPFERTTRSIQSRPSRGASAATSRKIGVCKERHRQQMRPRSSHNPSSFYIISYPTRFVAVRGGTACHAGWSRRSTTLYGATCGVQNLTVARRVGSTHHERVMLVPKRGSRGDGEVLLIVCICIEAGAVWYRLQWP